MMSKKAGLYVRVSTSEQTTENQERELIAYCGRHDWKVSKIFKDEGISGTVTDRPGLTELMTDARQGKLDLLVVWKIDRLARSISHLIEILAELKGLGVGFVSITEGINTESAQGRMLASFLGAIAEFERELIVERVRSGINRARSQGVTLGRPRKGFDIAKAICLRNEGMGYKQIAKQLNIPRSTLHRALKDIPKTLT